MRATVPGPAFLALVQPILDTVGPHPHARLQTDRKPAEADPEGEEATTNTRPRKQPNRHVKCACGTCGYLTRTARKWLDQVGPPHCPRHGPMHQRQRRRRDGLPALTDILSGSAR